MSSCADNETFTDEWGMPCSTWRGWDCSRAVENWGYTLQGGASLLANCQASCGECGDGLDPYGGDTYESDSGSLPGPLSGFSAILESIAYYWTIVVESPLLPWAVVLYISLNTAIACALAWKRSKMEKEPVPPPGQRLLRVYRMERKQPELPCWLQVAERVVLIAFNIVLNLIPNPFYDLIKAILRPWGSIYHILVHPTSALVYIAVPVAASGDENHDEAIVIEDTTKACWRSIGFLPPSGWRASMRTSGGTHLGDLHNQWHMSWCCLGCCLCCPCLAVFWFLCCRPFCTYHMELESGMVIQSGRPTGKGIPVRIDPAAAEHVDDSDDLLVNFHGAGCIGRLCSCFWPAKSDTKRLEEGPGNRCQTGRCCRASSSVPTLLYLEQPWRRWKDIIAALLPKPKMPEFVTEALNDQCKAVLDQIPCQAISTTLPQMPPMPVMLSHLRDHCEQLWDQGKLELKQLQEVGAAVAREAKQLESMGLEGIVSAVGPEKARVVVQLASAQSAVLTSHLRDIVKAKMHTGLISKARAVIEALEQPGPPQVQELDEVFEEIQAAPMIERIAATKTIADSVSNWLEQAVQILGRVADAPEVEKDVQSPVIKALLAFKDSVSTAVESKGTATADTITNATTTSKATPGTREPLAKRLTDQFHELPSLAATGAEAFVETTAGGLEELRPAHEALATVHAYVSMVGSILGQVESILRLAVAALSSYQRHGLNVAVHVDDEHTSDEDESISVRAQVADAVQALISDLSSAVLDTIIDVLIKQVEAMMQRLLSGVGADALEVEVPQEAGASDDADKGEEGIFEGLVFNDVMEAELPDECSAAHTRRVLLSLVMFDLTRANRYSQ